VNLRPACGRAEITAAVRCLFRCEAISAPVAAAPRCLQLQTTPLRARTCRAMRGLCGSRFGNELCFGMGVPRAPRLNWPLRRCTRNRQASDAVDRSCAKPQLKFDERQPMTPVGVCPDSSARQARATSYWLATPGAGARAAIVAAPNRAC